MISLFLVCSHTRSLSSVLSCLGSFPLSASHRCGAHSSRKKPQSVQRSRSKHVPHGLTYRELAVCVYHTQSQCPRHGTARCAGAFTLLASNCSPRSTTCPEGAEGNHGANEKPSSVISVFSVSPSASHEEDLVTSCHSLCAFQSPTTRRLKPQYCKSILALSATVSEACRLRTTLLRDRECTAI